MAETRSCGQTTPHEPHQYSTASFRYGKPIHMPYKCAGVSVPALDGATNEPPEGVMLSSAGEFAARWNALRPDVREKLWKALQSAANDGYQCHLKNHDGLEAEHAALFQKHVAAKHEIQGLLDSLDSHVTQDEIYSQLKTIQEAL